MNCGNRCPHLGNSDFAQFSKLSRAFLLRIGENRTALRALILQIGNNKNLLSCSAHYDAVDKLVLWNSEGGKAQLRLHIYSDQSNRVKTPSQINIAQAHNHRWNFSTLILAGGYLHTLYRVDKKTCTPMIIRHEGPGCAYTLHHSQYHAVVENPDTVTLILRGPLEKERFQIIKKEDTTVNIQDAPLLNSSQEMRKERYLELVSKLARLNVIAEPRAEANSIKTS